MTNKSEWKKWRSYSLWKQICFSDKVHDIQLWEKYGGSRLNSMALSHAKFLFANSNSSGRDHNKNDVRSKECEKNMIVARFCSG